MCGASDGDVGVARRRGSSFARWRAEVLESPPPARSFVRRRRKHPPDRDAGGGRKLWASG